MAQPRSAARASRAERLEGRPTKAIVHDFRRAGPGYEVQFDPRTAYDFMVSLFLDDDDVSELSAEDRRWLTAALEGLPAEVHALIPDGHKVVAPLNLAGPIVESPEVRTAAQLVALLEATDDQALLRWLRADLLNSPELAPYAEGAFRADEAALAEIERISGEYSGAALLRDPARWLGMLRTAYRYWLTRYEPLEARIAEILKRDVADRTGDRATLEGSELVEQTTGGIRLLADPGVRRVILAPAYFGRPYNRIFSANGWRLFAYPVADSALGGTDRFTPPVSAIRLYRALGDETRLRILKLLGERDHYLTELAQELELSKPTIKHHLAQLRVAGLVTLTDEGSLTYYSLRRDRLEAAGKEVRDYLLK
jgi:DNA-binding transcriptional ArsR family regulator